jgi:hypothetical protein
MVITAAKGVVAQFIDQTKKSYPLTPDTTQANWNYLSFFEFTASERKESTLIRHWEIL